MRLDSLHGFSHLRLFTEAHAVEIAAVVLFLAYVTQGLLHGALYAYGKWFDIHLASELHAAVVCVLAYTAGLDLLQIIGAAILAMPLFQGLLNLGSGLPFTNRREKREYLVAGMDMSWKRWAVGTWRWVKAPVGLALAFYQQILEAV